LMPHWLFLISILQHPSLMATRWRRIWLYIIPRPRGVWAGLCAVMTGLAPWHRCARVSSIDRLDVLELLHVWDDMHR
jgi:hypothetical protein